MSHPLLHFPCGFIGEGDGQNIPGFDPLRQKISDAVGDDARFSRARSRQNQKRAVAVRDGFPLREIEVIEIDQGIYLGIQNVKVAPLPTWEVAAIWPPCSLIVCLAKVSPSPVPPLVPESCWNF